MVGSKQTRQDVMRSDRNDHNWIHQYTWLMRFPDQPRAHGHHDYVTASDEIQLIPRHTHSLLMPLTQPAN